MIALVQYRHLDSMLHRQQVILGPPDPHEMPFKPSLLIKAFACPLSAGPLRLTMFPPSLRCVWWSQKIQLPRQTNEAATAPFPFPKHAAQPYFPLAHQHHPDVPNRLQNAAVMCRMPRLYHAPQLSIHRLAAEISDWAYMAMWRASQMAGVPFPSTLAFHALDISLPPIHRLLGLWPPNKPPVL